MLQQDLRGVEVVGGACGGVQRPAVRVSEEAGWVVVS